MEFVIGLVAGAIGVAIYLLVNNFLKWPLIVVLVGSALAGAGSVSMQDVQRVQAVCPGSSSDACSFVHLFLLSAYAPWAILAGGLIGCVVAGLVIEQIKKSHDAR